MAALREAHGPCSGMSLLFTPTTKAADGQKGPTPGDFRSFSGLGRTPASAGRAFGGGSAPAAGPTPSSRRRSLTPASSRQQDTPPPPPMDSLQDSPGGMGPSSAAWAQADGMEEMQVSTSPYAAIAAARVAPAAAVGQELALVAHTLEALDDTWVTVFGFGQADLPLVIREFSKAGDIQQFGTFGEPAQVNWVHIQYQNKHAMQRALLRNGDQLSASCMVGVKPLDAEHRAAVEKHGSAGSGGGPSFAMAFPKPQQQRPYSLGVAVGATIMVPLASKGLTQRVKEFVLGY